MKSAEFIVDSVVTKEKKRNPVPPFTTSKLQQDAARRLRFTVKKTMMLAQRLYEGIELRRRRPHRSDHLHAYRLHAHFR